MTKGLRGRSKMHPGSAYGTIFISEPFLHDVWTTRGSRILFLSSFSPTLGFDKPPKSPHYSYPPLYPVFAYTRKGQKSTLEFFF